MSFVHGGQEGAAPVGSGGGVWERGLGAGSGAGSVMKENREKNNC